jgi:hypothetical protein
LEGTTFPNPLSGLCTNNRRSVPTSDVTVILLLFFAMLPFLKILQKSYARLSQ